MPSTDSDVINQLKQDAIAQNAPIALFFLTHSEPYVLATLDEARRSDKPAFEPSPFTYIMR